MIIENPNILKTKRDLPHWTRDHAVYWITFRLADSIPQDKLRGWHEEHEHFVACHPQPWDEAVWEKYDAAIGWKLDKWMDDGMGSRALAREDVREAVRKCLLFFDGERLTLHAAVIMPTHVHCLLEPFAGFSLSKLMQSIKGVSAREANKLLAREGTFWFDESYDHIVRSMAQYEHFARYVRENPVKAGLREGEYWLYFKENVVDRNVFPSWQTRMSATPSWQTGMSATPLETP